MYSLPPPGRLTLFHSIEITSAAAQGPHSNKSAGWQIPSYLMINTSDEGIYYTSPGPVAIGKRDLLGTWVVAVISSFMVSVCHLIASLLPLPLKMISVIDTSHLGQGRPHAS